MICNSCGNGIQDNLTVCSQCGADLQESSQLPKAKKPFYKKAWFWCVVIVVGVVVFGIIGMETEKAGLSAEDAKQVIEGLQSFTDVEEDTDLYDFVYDDWTIRYGTGNAFVKFDYSSVENFIGGYFGSYCMYDGGYVGYDFDENEIRIYIDGEIEEGNVTIINYNLGTDECTLNVDSERYDASDELLEWMEQCEVVESVQEEIDEFKTVLEEKNLSYEKVSSMTYQNIVDYFE